MESFLYNPDLDQLRYTLKRDGWSDFLESQFKTFCKREYTIEPCSGNDSLVFVTVFNADNTWFTKWIDEYEQIKVVRKEPIIALWNRICDIFADDYARKKFRSLIELILTVEANFGHIVELEMIADSFKNYRNEYHSQYTPLLIKAYHLASEVAEVTRQSHYNKSNMSEYHVLSVYGTYLLPKNERHIHKEYEYLKNKFDDENMETDQPLEKK